MSSKKKITIYDIAREANTSICTVSKALTGKPKVSDKKRQEIIKTANRLGYKANKIAHSLARKTIKIGILLPTDWPQFHTYLEKGIRSELQLLQDYNIEGVFEYIPDTRSIQTDIRGIVNKMLIKDISALILCPEFYYDFTGLLKEMKDRNIPVLLAGNNLSYGSRLSYIGVDSELSGKLAAEVGRSFIGDKNNKTHIKKADGFKSEAEYDPFVVSGTYETRDDPDTAFDVTRKLIAEHPETELIYVATGNSATVCKYLYQNGLKVKVIGTDIFPELVEYMKKGIVIASIFQNPMIIGKQSIRVLNSYFSEHTVPKKNILIPPQVVFRNNVHLFE